MADNASTPTTTTTLNVHRCRFVDYAPSAITALCFPPLPLPSLKGKNRAPPQKFVPFGTLAVGHANGNIDICEWAGTQNSPQSTQAWVPRKTLYGLYPSKVDSLAFAIRDPELMDENDVPKCHELRLFSSGGGSELLEWDIERGTLRRTISSQGGSIWSMAVNPASTLLALGCEDGTVRLLSIENDNLSHVRKFDRVKCRILSIAWGPPIPRHTSQAQAENAGDSSDDDDEEPWKDAWLVTGGSDSSLRKWDVVSGRVIDRMGMDKIRGERTLVWSIGVMGNGTIVSGDSLGMVKFWDGRTCTQLQNFQAHGADVLCMTIGPDGRSVYTAGVDQKIAQFALVKTANSEKNRSSSRWVQTSSRRLHSHDIRSLAIWPPYSVLPPQHKRTFLVDVAPVLASGGLDMSVVLTPASLPSSTVVKITNPLVTSVATTFEESYQRRLAYARSVPTGSVRIARNARLVYCLREAGVTMWRVKKPLSDLDIEVEQLLNPLEEQQAESWEKVLEMELSVNTNVVASAISDDGLWFVISDVYETKLFRLHAQENGPLSIKRIRAFTAVIQPHIPVHNASTGGAAFQFTPDSSKLVMSMISTSSILVIDLGSNPMRVLRTFDHHRLKSHVLHGRMVVGRRASEDVEMKDGASQGDDSVHDEEAVADNEPTILTDVLHIAISPDGQWLATSDNNGRTHMYNLDSIQHHGVLPSFPHPVQHLAFNPDHPSLLIMAFPNNSLYIYDVEVRQSPNWARDLCNNLPKRLTHSHDPILGIAFDPAIAEVKSQSGDASGSGDVPARVPLSSTPKYALLWGSTWMCKLPLGAVVEGRRSKKRRWRDNVKVPVALFQSQDGEGLECKMITHYRPILAADFVGPRELVIVERPLVDVLATLPPAFFKHKYGSS